LALSLPAVAQEPAPSKPSNESPGRLVGTNLFYFLEFDSATGRAHNVSGLGLGGFDRPSAMAYDPNSQTLYAASPANMLITFDVTTGRTRPVGPLGWPVRGLAFDPNTNTLYGSDTEAQELAVIDTNTGLATPVGSLLPYYEVENLAFDPTTDTLYGLNNRVTLLTIDTADGTPTEVGTLSDYIDGGLTFDTVNGKLLSTGEDPESGSSASRLVSIDPQTLELTYWPNPLIVNLNQIWALALDPNTQCLFAADTWKHIFLEIDRDTGVAGRIGQWGYPDVDALTYDPANDVLYAVDFHLLIRIDAESRRVTEIGSIAQKVRGLAFDPITRTLFGSAINPSELLIIDQNTAGVTVVGRISDGMGGVHHIYGLAFDTVRRQLFGVGPYNDALVQINRQTGAGTNLGPLGFDNLEGLAFDPRSRFLYAVANYWFDRKTPVIEIDPDGPTARLVGIAPLYETQAAAFDQTRGHIVAFEGEFQNLWSINPLNLSTHTMDALGHGNVLGMDYDPDSDTIYAVAQLTGHLLTVDQITGETTTIGPIGIENVQGLAYNSLTNTLFGSASPFGSPPPGGQLITLNVTTGAASPVGPIGFQRVFGLAFDPFTNTLYGVDRDTDQLITIDQTAGTGTTVGPTGFDRIGGLAFNIENRKLYGADRATQQLVEIDPATGAGTAVGPTGHPDIYALSYAPKVADCNLNRLPDDDDLANGTSLDCNGNAVPDECDLGDGSSQDENANAVPDECDPSACCRLAGGINCTEVTSADCAKIGGVSGAKFSTCRSAQNPRGFDCRCMRDPADCNHNAVPDACDISRGTSRDVFPPHRAPDGIPDECQTRTLKPVNPP